MYRKKFDNFRRSNIYQFNGKNIKTLIRMHEIIYINFFVIAISASASATARIYNCAYVPQSLAYVCGSDGKTNKNIYHFWCAQQREYGVRVNLQLERPWLCFIWESYDIEIISCIYRRYRTTWKKM